MYVHLIYTQLSDKYSLSTVEKIIERIKDRAKKIKDPEHRKSLLKKIDDSHFVCRDSDGYVVMMYYPDVFDGHNCIEYPVDHISKLLQK